MRKKTSRFIKAYGLAVVTVLVALLLTLQLREVMAHGHSLPFLAAVVISARYGGLGSGLFATLLGVVSLHFFFVVPLYSLVVREINSLAWLFLFAAVAFLISSLDASRKKAEEKLKIANLELEGRVKERTLELAESNKDLQCEVERREKIAEEKETLINEIKETLAQVRVLRGLLPVCTHCRKIRDNRGYWKEFESYIVEHSEATFSRTTCPECAKAIYPKYPFADDATAADLEAK
jgi:K+-sensing histidine kinase KdpD